MWVLLKARYSELCNIIEIKTALLFTEHMLSALGLVPRGSGGEAQASGRRLSGVCLHDLMDAVIPGPGFVPPAGRPEASGGLTSDGTTAAGRFPSASF